MRSSKYLKCSLASQFPPFILEISSYILLKKKLNLCFTHKSLINLDENMKTNEKILLRNLK